MKLNEILRTNPLERSLPKEEGEAFEKILKQANESYVLIWTKEQSVNVNGLQFWNYYVYCPRKNFADAYSHLGLLYGQYVLPIWIKRHQNQKS